MPIQTNSVVHIDYTLKDDSGEVLDSSDGREPLAYLHGHGNIIPGLEKALEGRDEGDTFQAEVSPEEGYGHHRDELVQDVAREQFQGVDDLEPGMRFQAQSDAGPMVVTVTDVGEEQVTVDGNHALAGQNLQFDVSVKEVREATAEEIEHGHVHEGDEHE